MDAPDRHDTMVEATELAQNNEYKSYHSGVVIASYCVVAVVAGLAARDVQKQRAARPGGVSADLVGAAAGKDGVSRCERAYTPAHSLDAHRDESTGAFERLAEVPRGRPMCPPRAPSIPSSRVSSR